MTEGDEENKIRVQFLKDSLVDIQGTIRAMDTKSSILFVFLLLPLAGIDKIIPEYINLVKECKGWLFLLLPSIASWIASLYFGLIGLFPMETPSNKIEKHVSIKGAYYQWRVTDGFKVWDSIFPNTPKISLTIPDALKDTPDNYPDYVNELQYEQMKLAYIRDMKSSRVKLFIASSVIWVVSLLFIFGFAQ